MGIDQDLVIPNTGLSIYEDAIACWRGDTLSKYKEDIIFNLKNGIFQFTNLISNFRKNKKLFMGRR